jgi:hypothetical protein
VRSSAPAPGERVGQVRGIFAERVVVSTPLDPWLSVKALAAYSGLSVRTLRSLLTTSVHPLPHYRIGGRLLVRVSEYDAWTLRYRQLGDATVDHIVAETMQELRAGRPGAKAPHGA